MSAVKKLIGSRIQASDIHRASQPSIKEVWEAIKASPPPPPRWADVPDDVDDAIQYYNERRAQKYGRSLPR